ncbi:hypothetical protein M231_05623 [Tremella mesenterica]|uniref:Uncharacterized protein n=1 Tax=Tremella mesenterica TaxID=5217 RepID=A0A4V1M3J7_TREME|nr:hypothetical protein M231_05623 [Tremella mesenterica]
MPSEWQGHVVPPAVIDLIKVSLLLTHSLTHCWCHVLTVSPWVVPLPTPFPSHFDLLLRPTLPDARLPLLSSSPRRSTSPPWVPLKDLSAVSLAVQALDALAPLPNPLLVLPKQRRVINRAWLEASARTGALVVLPDAKECDRTFLSLLDEPGGDARASETNVEAPVSKAASLGRRTHHPFIPADRAIRFYIVLVAFLAWDFRSSTMGRPPKLVDGDERGKGVLAGSLNALRKQLTVRIGGISDDIRIFRSHLQTAFPDAPFSTSPNPLGRARVTPAVSASSGPAHRRRVLPGKAMFLPEPGLETPPEPEPQPRPLPSQPIRTRSPTSKNGKRARDREDDSRSIRPKFGETHDTPHMDGASTPGLAPDTCTSPGRDRVPERDADRLVESETETERVPTARSHISSEVWPRPSFSFWTALNALSSEFLVSFATFHSPFPRSEPTHSVSLGRPDLFGLGHSGRMAGVDWGEIRLLAQGPRQGSGEGKMASRDRRGVLQMPVLYCLGTAMACNHVDDDIVRSPSRPSHRSKVHVQCLPPIDLDLVQLYNLLDQPHVSPFHSPECEPGRYAESDFGKPGPVFDSVIRFLTEEQNDGDILTVRPARLVVPLFVNSSEWALAALDLTLEAGSSPGLGIDPARFLSVVVTFWTPRSFHWSLSSWKHGSSPSTLSTHEGIRLGWQRGEVEVEIAQTTKVERGTLRIESDSSKTVGDETERTVDKFLNQMILVLHSTWSTRGAGITSPLTLPFDLTESSMGVVLALELLMTGRLAHSETEKGEEKEKKTTPSMVDVPEDLGTRLVYWLKETWWTSPSDR